MATTVLGNLALPVDLITQSKTTKPHHRISLPFDVVLSLNLPSSRREKDAQLWNTESPSERGKKVKFSKRTNYEENGKEKENNEEEDEIVVEEDDVDVEVFDWEVEMRKRVKEIEEMRELEKKAEELVGKGGGDEERENVDEESEEHKKMRVRKELEKVAKEQAERRKTAQLMFDLGQKAYGRGMYGRAVEFLEAALTIIPRITLLGGEIQIWLAMAYEANNRHADCIDLYQQLEKKHPSASIRRQAAELRYIMQAPKIKITQEEMVTIPLIGSSYDSYASTWTDKDRDRAQTTSGSTTNQLSSSRDYAGDILKWKPPVGLENNPAFWAAVTLWLGLVGAALFLQR